MEDLFATRASNAHQSLLLREPDKLLFFSTNMNRAPLLNDWQPMEFEFQAVDKRSIKLPSICTVFFSGLLAFRAVLKAELFTSDCNGLEFLPIAVGDEQWLLLNCLKTVRQFDEGKSEVMRGLYGDIFMVLKLHVTDPAAKGYEMFTLAESNRAELFVRSAFKDRVEKLGLKGITFQRIGKVV